MTDRPIEGPERPGPRGGPDDALHAGTAARHQQRLVVRLGLAISPPVAAAAAGYLLLTPDGPGRPVLWWLLLAAFAVTAAMLLLDRTRALGPRVSTMLLQAWALTITVIVAAAIAVDGGLSSPATPMLLLPLLAGSLVFSPRLVLAHGTLTVVAIAVAEALSGSPVAGRALLWSTSTIAVVVLASNSSRSMWRLVARLDQANDELTQLARVDLLTGCLNHGTFHGVLHEAFSRQQAERRPIALLQLDVDHFKEVNDRHGHPVGDEVLATVAQRLRAAVRPDDVVGRVGGEEFAVIFMDTDLHEAAAIGERVRAAIAEQRRPVGVTVSGGLAVAPDHAASAEELVTAADRALYVAKRRGRDRLVVHDPDDPDEAGAPRGLRESAEPSHEQGDHERPRDVDADASA